MKIISREEFLRMPTNTLYSTHEPQVFGDLCIKGETIEPADFFLVRLKDCIGCYGLRDLERQLDDAEKHKTTLNIDLYDWYRDDGYDVRLFAIWEGKDVFMLIESLLGERE